MRKQIGAAILAIMVCGAIMARDVEVAGTPTPGPIVLMAQGKRIGGINRSRLKWRGATSGNVDVYRDGLVIATIQDSGRYTDSTGTTGQASFVYKVCEAGTQTCSNPVTVNFPPL